MSRAYLIRLSESVIRHVHVEDGVKACLELLEVLPRERMAALLAGELEQRGFVREGSVLRRVDEDGIEITVDPEEATVTVRVVSEERVELEREGQARGRKPDDPEAAERLRRSLQEQLEREVDQKRRGLQAEATARLEKKLRDIREELDQVTSRVTAAALKQRAAELGEIQEISEDEARGELTIKVRL